MASSRSLPRRARRAARERLERVTGIDQVRQHLSEVREELRQTRAELKQSRTRLTQARQEARQAAADLATARRTVEKATASGEAAKEKVTRFGYAYRGLRAAGLGLERAGDLGHAPGTPPEPAARADHEQELAAVWRRSRFASLLASGAGLDGAIAALVREARGLEETTEARQVAQWLHDSAGTEVAGVLGTGLMAHRMGLPRFAWERLSTLPPEVWVAHAASEYVVLAGGVDTETAAAAVDEVLSHDELVDTRGWLDLTRRAIGLGLADRVGPLAARFDAAAARSLASDDLGDHARRRLEEDRAWIARWAPRVSAGPVPTLARVDGVVPIAVMGYDQPDLRNTSTNIGDYVQTIASLAHVARHTGVEYVDDDLGRLARELAGRVPEHLRVDSAPARVSLHPVDRDASSYSAVPEGTWLLAFGWYAHKLGGVRHDLPFPERLRPIYVSFHLNKRDLLTAEMIEHLRRHAPIGCRDWSTVDVLLGLGIPAFFSGCLTTTVRYLRPDDAPAPPADAPDLYVDLPAEGDARSVRNERHEVALQDLETNLREALDVLDTYASEVGRVVTRRLHAYLPARAMGREVDFRPTNPNDIRFAGLDPLTDDEVHEMGRAIADLLEPILAAILRGESEEDVRAVWRGVTDELVEEAKARHAAQVELESVFDVAEAVRTIRESMVHVPATEQGPGGEPLEIVIALDGNLKDQSLVVVDGLVENASRPIRLSVLCRDHDESDRERMAALFPTVATTWYPCDEITYGEVIGMIPHITVSTMDRLLLPDLLADVDRVVYHDIDALPVADVAKLYDTDLAGMAVAARDSEASSMQSGYTNIFVPASFSGLPPGMGAELVRRATRRHPFDFVGFNAGIMVLDLARMRADRFCETYIPYASSFGMNDQQILNVYAGAGRVALDPAWNARPSQETVHDPKIIHWAGTQKPWGRGYVSYRDRWERQEERVRRRESSSDEGRDARRPDAHDQPPT